MAITSWRSGLWRGVQVLLPLLLSGGLLYLVGAALDLSRITQRLLSISPWYVAAALACLVLNIVVVSYRYQLIITNLTGKRPALFSVLEINWLSLFLSQILPAAMLADVLRSAAAWRLLKLSRSDSVVSVLHDRVIALGGIIVCVTITLPFLVTLGMQSHVIAAAATAAVCGVGVAAIITVTRLNEPKIAASRNPAVAILYRVVAGVGSHVSNRRQIATQLGLAVASMGAFTLQFWVLAWGVGIDMPLGIAALVSPLISLAQVVPFLYSGFGLREGVTIAILSGGGWASPETAMALGLAVGVTNILTSLPGAFAAGLLLGGRRP